MDSIEQGRRIKAARAYAGLEQLDLAELLNLSVRTIVRIENGKRPLSASELGLVAEKTELPAQFFTVDFNQLGALPAEEPDWAQSLRQRMDRLEDEWSSAQLDALGAALATLQRSGGANP